jgi:hypothetical protein
MEKMKSTILQHIAQCNAQIAVCDDVYLQHRELDYDCTILLHNRIILRDTVARLEELTRLLTLIEELEQIV